MYPSESVASYLFSVAEGYRRVLLLRHSPILICKYSSVQWLTDSQKTIDELTVSQNQGYTKHTLILAIPKLPQVLNFRGYFLQCSTVLILTVFTCSAHANNDVPFVDGETICDVCSCATPLPQPGQYYNLDCTARGLNNILSSWPKDFHDENEGKGNF